MGRRSEPGETTMIFDRTGRVSDGFYVLGSPAVPVYLLDGPSPVIFDAGLTCLGDVYVEAVREVLGKRSPALLCLTHVHFDHCGAASRLKRAFPGMQVAGSERSRQILQRPNAIRLIRELNRNAADAVYGIDPALLVDEPFQPCEIDRVIEPGGTVPLGPGLGLRALHTPGHTWDFLSFHVPERALLVASEAAGVLHPNDYVVCECLVSFEAYLTSLRRLAGLGAEILCQAHHYVFTGPDVEAFFRRSTRMTLEFHALVERIWEETGGDLQETVERVKTLEYDPMPAPRQPEAAYRLNLEARIRSARRP
ncbi:MAG: MBL fold metallo-hydrolase [Deltaproteobacteria bacterium]|nr:MBL fold metallo-hydrolase [Deltaproteobacteria bacterium]